MKTFDGYIVRTFLSSYLVLLVGFVALYIFGDVLVNFDEFTKDKSLTAREILVNMADYYGHNLPLYYAQLGGVVLTLAAGFTFAYMLWNNELVALVAAGVPLQRLAVPATVCSIVLVAAWAANVELVVPHYAQQIARAHDDLSDTRTIDVQCVRDDNNAILTAEELHLQSRMLRGLYIVEAQSGETPLRTLIRADAATWNPAARTWSLDRGVKHVVAGGVQDADLSNMAVSVQRVPLSEYPFTLGPEEILLRQSSQWAELMSTTQMTALLKGRNLPNLRAVERARDVRVTQPLLAGILMFLAIPFFLTREPTNVFAAGAKALLLCGACYACIFIFQNLGTDAYLRSAVFFPVLFFGPVAVLHLANVKT